MYLLISICSISTSADFFEKTLAVKAYLARTVLFLTSSNAISAFQAECIVIFNARLRNLIYIIKALTFLSNAALANFI